MSRLSFKVQIILFPSGAIPLAPLLLKRPSQNATSRLLDPTASLVQVSLTPSQRTQNGGSLQLRADPRQPTRRRPHPLTSASISWTAKARQRHFRLLIR